VENNISEGAGVIVSAVKSGGKGAQAGIMVGDIIEEVNYNSIKTVNDFRESVNQVKKGDAIKMFIKRKNVGFIVLKVNI